MRLNLENVVIGSDLTGMILAPILGAIFIPVSFNKSFAWEYDNSIEHPFVNHVRNLDRRMYNNIDDNEYRYIISKNGNPEHIKTFYWELENVYRYFLSISGGIYNNFGIMKANNLIKNQINFSTKYGTELIVNYKKCWIINPNSNWFKSYLEPIETIESETCHLLHHLVISKQTEDMKGVQYENDIQEIENGFFDMIWNSSPTGPKKYLVGYSPFQKRKTLTTRNIVFVKKNVPIEELDDEKYCTASVRIEMYKILSQYNKRIAERYSGFDKSISKIVVSTNLDIYENTDDTNFIYYDDKKEIICRENLQLDKWQLSSQRQLYQTMDSIINSIYSSEYTKM